MTSSNEDLPAMFRALIDDFGVACCDAQMQKDGAVAALVNARIALYDAIMSTVSRLRQDRDQAMATLEARAAELESALEDLVDHQNGCPLPKYEKEWTNAMERAHKLLGST